MGSMVARLCSCFTVLLGALGLTRWMFGVPTFLFTRSWSNSTAPNTAILLMIVGGCGWVLASRSPTTVRLAARYGRAMTIAGVVLAFAAVYRLTEISFDVDLGFDSTFRKLPHLTIATPSAGTMSFPTSVCFLLSGFAVILMSRWLAVPRARTISGWLAAACAAVAAVFALGYAYGQPLTYGGRPVAMSANTALAFLGVGTGLALIVSSYERWSRLRMVATLRRARESLEYRVTERTSALSTALLALKHEADERRKSETSLIHAQKMESIGRLAAGIAHDFNNLLLVIRTSAELIERQPGTIPTAMGMLRQIRDASQSGTAMTARLLSFARKAPAVELTPVPAAPLLREVVSLVRPMLGSGITARVVAEPELWSVNADPGQIEQVLVNLCINAKDAMPAGGTLTVLASNAAVVEPLPATPEVVPPGDYVVVEVKDTGIGMSREVISHAFEPFFTTKADGHGSGLGLATSYGIVRQHGGRITVESEPGVGTQFRIFLPRAIA